MPAPFPAGTTLDTDLAIIGGGPAGIALALALANTPIRILMLESGGDAFEPQTQALYAGSETGTPYLKLENSRLRYLGGSSNHWGGWCRPLDRHRFRTTQLVAAFGLAVLHVRSWNLISRARNRCARPVRSSTTTPTTWTKSFGAPIPLGEGGVYTTYMQFSKTRDSYLPTHFGERYGDELKRIPNLNVMLHANVTGLRLANNARASIVSTSRLCKAAASR